MIHLTTLSNHLISRKTIIQPKLSINSPGDKYEQEADAMADRVMRMPAYENNYKPKTGIIGASVQRKCASCEEEDKKKKPIMRKSNSGPGGMQASDSFISSLNTTKGGGSPLPHGTRSIMENAFSADFSKVRLHTDDKAAEMSKGINAKAFTIGDDIYFHGEYSPDSQGGKRLLAHELTHVVQQEAAEKQSIQRTEERPNLEALSEDPNFLLCFALCELGLPPGIWRQATNAFLEAQFEEYRQERGEARATSAFNEFSIAFSAYSNLNRFKAVLAFIAEGRIGPIVLTSLRATAIRNRILARLTELGIERGLLVAASQIVRKVMLVIEVAYAAGCIAYCGSMAYINFISEMTDALISILQSIQTIANSVGSAIGGFLSRTILYTRALLNSANWELSLLPQRSRNHLNVVGALANFSADYNPDQFIAFVSRQFSPSLDPSFFNELSQDINTVLHRRGGFFQAIQFTPEFIRQQSPISLIQILNEYGIIQFLRDPNLIATEASTTR